MNKVFLSGYIMDSPVMRLEANEVSHLTFKLGVQHRTKAGEIRREAYRISAWNASAQWGGTHLTKGQTVGIQGYLTQHQISMGTVSVVATEVAAEEFLLMGQRPNAEAGTKEEEEKETV